MSDSSIDQPLEQRRLAFVLTLCRIVFTWAVMLGIGLPTPAIHAEQDHAAEGRPMPLLVRARQGDTPASLASRYLNDASKAWMIAEYNGLISFSDGQAVLVPTAPFHLGGLTPSGYQTVPVLAYTAAAGSSSKNAPAFISVFEEQMSWLANSGYTAISPDQLIDFMAFSDQIPRQAVLITADTESLAFFDQAVPILESFDFTATLCVATTQVGKPGNMTWDQLRQLHQAGFAIGCRGRSGRSLIRRPGAPPLESDFAKIEAELRQAKKAVENHLGSACTILAYPQGQTNDLVSAMVAKLGFSLAFVRSTGENPFFGNRFGIHRIVIDRRLDPGEFTRMLTTMTVADLH